MASRILYTFRPLYKNKKLWETMALLIVKHVILSYLATSSRHLPNSSANRVPRRPRPSSSTKSVFQYGEQALSCSQRKSSVDTFAPVATVEFAQERDGWRMGSLDDVALMLSVHRPRRDEMAAVTRRDEGMSSSCGVPTARELSPRIRRSNASR